ncbi:hypothetical protein PV327_005005 [Microctonus hyperodae]|uniref:oleoyl-[acyl-carrier-protein] hydrolase n=1 Tax=Microctonus hyperodae TaxID=165561 RepID=A0AA39KN38_MICHY|nr:hypothetical protein PV327_005005 [Microctonus hyperodae]
MNSQNITEKKKNIKNTGNKDIITGMKLLIRSIGSETAQTEVLMKLQNKRVNKRHQVFLIPGIEGCGSIFSNLASNIKSPTTCLQLDNTRSNYLSIPDIANELWPHILSCNKGRRDFVITGYSFGSLIAIELARKFEAEGLTGRLILIDGAPELMNAIKDQHLAALNSEELETNVLLGIMDILTPTSSDSSELLIGLQQCTSWQEKLDKFVASIPAGTLALSTDYQRNFCTSIYNRLIALENYDISRMPPLRSSILLLKSSMLSVTNISNDYGLSAITREKIEIHTIEGNHITILDNTKVALAINNEPLEDADEFKATLMKQCAREATL